MLFRSIQHEFLRLLAQEGFMFTDNEAEPRGLQARVVEAVNRQKNFCDKQSFNFPILSDESKDVLKSYGAWGTKKMYGREYEGIYRYTYIIDENGMVEKAFSKVTTKTHAQDVLAELE